MKLRSSVIKTHQMKLQEKDFNLIKDGIKVYEVRLYDEKRKDVEIGDYIEFTNNSNTNEKITCLVRSIFNFDSFKYMTDNLSAKKLGLEGLTKKQIIDLYHEFYSKEDEEKYGVVAFWVEVREQENINNDINNDCNNTKADKNKDNYNINVKVENESQIINEFSYANSDKLNGELDNYIYNKAKHCPIKSNIQINIYTKKNLDEKEIKSAIQQNYFEEAKTKKIELKNNLMTTVTMLVLGIIFLSTLLLIYKFANNIYITTILDIFTWVFFWEVADLFFLRRPELRKEYIIFNKLSTSKIEIKKIK